MGCDGVGNVVLTAAAESPAFVRLCCRHWNQFHNTGTKPQSWEVNELGGLHKGGPVEDPNNLRGLVFGSNDSKAFELA